jgi:hypothetical protein
MSGLLGAVASTQLLQILSLPISGILAAILIRRWTDCCPWTAQAMGVAYALCPTHLSHLASGEISNTQAWILPAWLLAMSATDRAKSVVLTGVVAAMAAFSSPYSALALPLIGGVWVIGRLLGKPLSEGLVHARSQALGLVATGAAMIPAWIYYAQDRAGGGESIFQPARRAVVEVGPLPHPSPIASLESLVWSTGGNSGSPYEPVHGAYLGLFLLCLAIWATFRARGKGREAGLAMLAGGALLAMGPALAIGGEVLSAGGGTIPLPAAALEALGYPTRIGGLYYRYAMVAVLGACILGAQGLATRNHASRWAWVLLIFHLADSIRGTQSTWPRPAEPIAGYTLMQALEGTDGAVLELPIQGPTDAWFGQAALLRATLHRRPTTALPRGVRDSRGSVQGLWADAMDAPNSAASRLLLSEAGFRLVILPEALIPHIDPDLFRIETALGPALRADGLLVWDLGPTEQPPTCATGG